MEHQSTSALELSSVASLSGGALRERERERERGVGMVATGHWSGGTLGGSRGGGGGEAGEGSDEGTA